MTHCDQFVTRLPVVQLAKQLEEDPDSLPFKRLISCNIGNPQALQQKPISFFRDVISLFANPSLVCVFYMFFN